MRGRASRLYRPPSHAAVGAGWLRSGSDCDVSSSAGDAVRRHFPVWLAFLRAEEADGAAPSLTPATDSVAKRAAWNWRTVRSFAGASQFMWALMMTAMMLSSAAPTILLYATIGPLFRAT